jgi:pyruvate-formate lyase-activating enzyme
VRNVGGKSLQTSGKIINQNEILQDVEFLFIFLDAAEDEQPVRLQKYHPELVHEMHPPGEPNVL